MIQKFVDEMDKQHAESSKSDKVAPDGGNEPELEHWKEQIAHGEAEPEDQDYYGMGSRSARFTIMDVFGSVFCTLSLLMTIVALMHIWLSRIFCGRLFNSVEIEI